MTIEKLAQKCGKRKHDQPHNRSLHQNIADTMLPLHLHYSKCNVKVLRFKEDVEAATTGPFFEVNCPAERQCHRPATYHLLAAQHQPYTHCLQWRVTRAKSVITSNPHTHTRVCWPAHNKAIRIQCARGCHMQITDEALVCNVLPIQQMWLE